MLTIQPRPIPIQSANASGVKLAVQPTELTSWWQLHLEVVSGYSGDMLPLVCLEYVFEYVCILTCCTAD